MVVNRRTVLGTNGSQAPDLLIRNCSEEVKEEEEDGGDDNNELDGDDDDDATMRNYPSY